MSPETVSRTEFDALRGVVDELRGVIKELREVQAGLAEPPQARAWSMRAAAVHLGISRNRTLMPAIERGTIKTFRRGKRRFISDVEMVRLRREWLPTVQAKRTSSDRSARRYPDSCAL